MARHDRIDDSRNRREMSRVLDRPAARGALGLLTVVGVTGGIVGFFGVERAAADPVSRALRYTCSAQVIDVPITVMLHSDIPSSVAVGEPTSKFSISAAIPVNASETAGLRKIGIKSVEGRVDAKVRVTAPEGDSDITVPFHAPRSNVPASGPFSVKATGVAPTRTFSQPGQAKITVGDLTAHVTASGAMTVELDVPCKLDAAQDNVVASFDITGARTPADTETSGATRPQDPGESTAGGTATDGSTGPSGGQVTTSGQGVRGMIQQAARTIGGQGVKSPASLAVGAAILGILAVAAALRFRSRGGGA